MACRSGGHMPAFRFRTMTLALAGVVALAACATGGGDDD